jgi:DNA helicase IV
MMSEPACTDLDDTELRAERQYLADARAALRYMYEDVITTETQASAPAEDNDMFLEREAMQLGRDRRAQALIDLPDVPLFFGRLDFDPGTVHESDPGATRLPAADLPAPGPPAADLPAPGPPAADRVYIGRRHVHDAAGRPMVIDWRAPVSAAFYRASREDRRGVRLRRRFGFSDAAELTAYDDEPLTGPGAATGTPDAFLIAEIERPRSGPMRDIVATIQPEQDRLVRAPLETTLCVQGAPGTGKTAVGLHRVAYLLFTERDRLSRNGVVVVGPNRSFLSYIRNVLPALGEVSVDQTTIGELIRRRPGSRSEDPRVAALKGDVRMASVLRRALWLHVTRPTEGLLYVKGSFRYRVPGHEVSEIIAGLRGTTRFGPAREAAAKRLAHAVLVQMERGGEVTDDRTHAAVTRSRPVTQVLDQSWPKVTPEQVLFRLFTDAEFLARAARDDLTAVEQSLLLPLKPARSPKSAQWSAADCILLDELADLIERPATHGHIVVDEAQDLTPMQCRAVARRSAHGSLTVLGDMAQATSPGAADGWPVLLSHLGKPDATLTVLDRGYRVPAQIIDYAARLLPTIAPSLDVPTSARQAPGALRVTQIAAADLADAVTATCRERLRARGSVGVITADGDSAGICERLIADGLDAALLGENSDAMATARLACLPASLAKGLEFDAVIVVEPARIVAANPRGTQHLYIALTRAVSSLHVLHAEPLPAELS